MFIPALLLLFVIKLRFLKEKSHVLSRLNVDKTLTLKLKSCSALHSLEKKLKVKVEEKS